MFKIWQTECIKWNKTHGLNSSHPLFILLTKCGKTLILFPRNVPPTRIISLFLLIVIKSYESKKTYIFFWLSPALIKGSLLIRRTWSDSFICFLHSNKDKSKLTPHSAALFPEIKSSWSETEVTASSFSWKPPTMQHCAETVWLIANTQCHFDSWNFSVFLAFECEQMT